MWLKFRGRRRFWVLPRVCRGRRRRGEARHAGANGRAPPAGGLGAPVCPLPRGVFVAITTGHFVECAESASAGVVGAGAWTSLPPSASARWACDCSHLGKLRLQRLGDSCQATRMAGNRLRWLRWVPQPLGTGATEGTGHTAYQNLANGAMSGRIGGEAKMSLQCGDR